MQQQIRALIEAGTLARRSDRPLDAHRHFGEAVTLSRQCGVKRELIHALKGLGQIERDMSQGDAALPLYEEAVAICRDEGDSLLLAHTLRHLGDIHQDAGRLDLAEPCYREALAIYRSDTRCPQLDLANAIRPFAILQERRRNTADALALWTEARDLYAALDIREGVIEGTKRLERLTRSSP